MSIPERNGRAIMHLQKRPDESYGWLFQVRGTEWGWFSEGTLNHPAYSHLAPLRWTIDQGAANTPPRGVAAIGSGE
jgi:hypothetical protein